MNRPPRLAMLNPQRAPDRAVEAQQATESKMTIPVQFELQSNKPCPRVESIKGTITRFDTGISCHYRITGDWNHLAWPELNPLASRRMGLWQDSCCELFVAEVGNTAYLELNVSASGDWNCFEFTDYRAGMRESDSYSGRGVTSAPQLRATKSLDVILDNTRHNDTGLLIAPTLEIGIAAVIREKPISESGGESDLYYYCLQPSSGKADFHDRNGFLIMLERPQ